MTVTTLAYYSIFEYLYRDAGNFKTHGGLLLIGYMSDADSFLRSCLDWGDQFVAEQVDISSLCPAHWESVGEGPSDMDHAYHEFVALRPASAKNRSLVQGGSLQALLARMHAAKGKWDVRLSPNWDL